ncbi:hypothetical protein RU349_000358 [Enterobacter kobei]|nr:hypothetical protein [Enterobacter kobei]
MLKLKHNLLVFAVLITSSCCIFSVRADANQTISKSSNAMATTTLPSVGHRPPRPVFISLGYANGYGTLLSPNIIDTPLVGWQFWEGAKVNYIDTDNNYNATERHIMECVIFTVDNAGVSKEVQREKPCVMKGVQIKPEYAGHRIKIEATHETVPESAIGYTPVPTLSRTTTITTKTVSFPPDPNGGSVHIDKQIIADGEEAVIRFNVKDVQGNPIDGLAVKNNSNPYYTGMKYSSFKEGNATWNVSITSGNTSGEYIMRVRKDSGTGTLTITGITYFRNRIIPPGSIVIEGI